MEKARKGISHTDARRSVSKRHKFPPPPRQIRPLPIWCHPEFEEFLDDYRNYVDHQINTFSIMLDIVSNDYTRNELAYWKSIRKSLKHLRWVGTRKNDF